MLRNSRVGMRDLFFGDGGQGTFCSPEPNSAQESLGRALRTFPGHCHRLSRKHTLSSPNSPLGSYRSMRGHLPSWPHLLVTTQEVELGN